MKLNKLFIIATGGAYIGLAIASFLGYPTVIGAPPAIIWGWLIVAGIFFVWSSVEPTPRWSDMALGILYGAIWVTFIGLENWGSTELNLAMALWDIACAVCFLIG